MLLATMKVAPQFSTTSSSEGCRNNAANAMKGSYADKGVRNSMSDILKRLHILDVEERGETIMEGFVESDDPATELFSRLSPSAVKLMSEMEATDNYDFHALPAADQRELALLFTSTAVDTVVTAWRPWWHAPEASQIRLNGQGQRLVVAVNSDTGDLESSVTASQEHVRPDSAPPSPPATAVPELFALTAMDPHPQIYLSLLQTLFAYCSAMYLYNGDPGGDLPGYMDTLWQLAPHLWQTTTESSLPATLGVAVKTSTKRLNDACATSVASHLDSDHSLVRWAWRSVASICACGRGAAVCAIADVNRQHEAAHRQGCSSAKNTGMHGSRRLGLLAAKKLKYCMRKAQFQTSFATSCADAQFVSWGRKIRCVVDAECTNDQLDGRLQGLIIND